MDKQEFDTRLQFVTRNIDRKLARLGSRLWIVKHVLALYRYLVDPQVHWVKKVLVVVALAYFIVPVDSIPDFTPVVGYLDDATVLAAVMKTLGKGFLKYYGGGLAVGKALS